MRFYFHLNNSSGWIHDKEGKDLDGVPQALENAIVEARAILCAEIADGNTIDLASYIAIDDEIGREVSRVAFGEVVTFANH